MAFNLEAMLTVPLALVLSVRCLAAVEPQCDSMRDVNSAIAAGIVAREDSSRLYRVETRHGWPVLLADPQALLEESSLIYDLKKTFLPAKAGERP